VPECEFIMRNIWLEVGFVMAHVLITIHILFCYLLLVFISNVIFKAVLILSSFQNSHNRCLLIGVSVIHSYIFNIKSQYVTRATSARRSGPGTVLVCVARPVICGYRENSNLNTFCIERAIYWHNDCTCSFVY
jgi:hypothetical protein